MQDQTLPTFRHLWIFGMNVYVFLYKEEQSLKSAKWESKVLKSKLVSFGGHPISRVYIKDRNKVIQVKDLQFFENITSKATTSLLNFDRKPTFDRIQISDEQTPSDKSSAFEKEKNAQKQSPKRPAKSQAGRSIKPTPK